MDRKTIKQRNFLAKLLRDPRYHQRVVRSKMSYARKNKHKKKGNEE